MLVRDATADDTGWIGELFVSAWGGSRIAAGDGRIVDASRLPALIAGDYAGLATYEIAAERRSAELVTLNAVMPGQGIGSALIEALADRLKRAGIVELRVNTTNDNLDALRFYQRRGFRLAALHTGAIDAARHSKPTIPQSGRYNIPIHDRLELVRIID